MKSLVRITLVLLSTLAVLCVGCSPEGTGVFVNPTEDIFVVSLSSSDEPSRLITFTLPSNATYSVRGTRVVNKLKIEAMQEDCVYERTLHLPDPEHVYSASGEMEMHFLVTDREVYRIPRNYRGKWRSHLDDIRQEANALKPVM